MKSKGSKSPSKSPSSKPGMKKGKAGIQKQSGGKGKANAKIMNKQANKSKRQRFRQESEVRKGKDDGKLKGKAGRKEKEEIMAEKEYGKKKSTPKPVLDVSLDEDRIHITKSDLHFYANRSLPDFLNGSDLASATVNMKKNKKRKQDNVSSEFSDEELAQPEDYSDSGLENEELDEDDNSDIVDSESDSNDEDIAGKYEGKVRTPKWEKESKSRLPIKSGNKVIPVRDVLVNKSDSVDSDIEENDDPMVSDEEEIEYDENSQHRMAEEAELELNLDPEIAEMRRRAHISQVKVLIATTASKIQENPEENITDLDQLLALCKDKDPVVFQLAVVSITELFKDIIPGYRIRLPTDAEKQNKVSKEIKSLRKFESALLNRYQSFVRLCLSMLHSLKDKISLSVQQNTVTDQQSIILAKRLKKRRRLLQQQHPDLSADAALKIAETEMADQSKFKDAQVAVICLSRLLSKVSHFNYSKDIISHLIPLINHIHPSISHPIYQAIISVFESDVSGNVTVEIMRLLAKLVKDRPSEASVRMMKTFLKLKLSFAVIFAVQQKQEKKFHKKYNKDTAKFERRRQKEAKIAEVELNKDMEEAEAEVRNEQKQKVQIELLNLIFSTYFRVLKSPNQATNLLPFVLQGLSRYAHLINVDLVIDLLEVLKDLIARRSMSFESSLHCAIAAFETLQGPGQALTMEIKDFYIHIFNLLWKLCDASNHEHIPLLLQALQLMFVKRRVMSVEIAGAFIQRLSTISSLLKPHDSIGLLSLLRLMLDKYPRSQQLLENEPTPSGIFSIDSRDPEHAHAFATSCWELTLLRSSYHPFLSKLAGMIISHSELPMTVTRTSPNSLLEAYSCTEGGFNPPVQKPVNFNLSNQSLLSLSKRPVSNFVENLQQKINSIDSVPSFEFFQGVKSRLRLTKKQNALRRLRRLLSKQKPASEN